MRDLKIERLPVTQKNKLMGIITERGITRIEPALIEIVREKAALEPKLAKDDSMLSGICESCENYSDNLRKKDDEYLCEECYEGR